MRLIFNIKNHNKVYDVLINTLGFEQDCFLTDDCIEIDEDDLNTINNILSDVKFKKLTIETIEERIEELEKEIEYEENKLECCGYGKNDLIYLENLQYDLEKFEELFDDVEE